MIRFVAEAFMSHGDELYVDNRKMVPIISEFMSEEGKQEHHY
jgi:hypothetical protein